MIHLGQRDSANSETRCVRPPSGWLGTPRNPPDGHCFRAARARRRRLAAAAAESRLAGEPGSALQRPRPSRPPGPAPAAMVPARQVNHTSPRWRRRTRPRPSAYVLVVFRSPRHHPVVLLRGRPPSPPAPDSPVRIPFLPDRPTFRPGPIVAAGAARRRPGPPLQVAAAARRHSPPRSTAFGLTQPPPARPRGCPAVEPAGGSSASSISSSALVASNTHPHPIPRAVFQQRRPRAMHCSRRGRAVAVPGKPKQVLHPTPITTQSPPQQPPAVLRPGFMPGNLTPGRQSSSPTPPQSSLSTPASAPPPRSESRPRQPAPESSQLPGRRC